jgi:hypothetical protein
MMKGFVSKFVVVGKKVDEDELKDYVLNGLDGTFDPLVAPVRDVPSMSFNDMCSQLEAYEYRDTMLANSGQPPLHPLSMSLLIIMGEAAATLDMVVVDSTAMASLLLLRLDMAVHLLDMVVDLLGTVVATLGMVVVASNAMSELLLLRLCINPIAKMCALLTKGAQD